MENEKAPFPVQEVVLPLFPLLFEELRIDHKTPSPLLGVRGDPIIFKLIPTLESL